MDASFCNLDPSALLRMTARDEGLWEVSLEQDFSGGVSAKDDKSVFDWAIQVRTTAGERAAYLACERVEALGSRLRHFGSAKVTLCAWADSKTTD